MKRAVLIDVRPLDPVVNQYMTPAVQKYTSPIRIVLHEKFREMDQKWMEDVTRPSEESGVVSQQDMT
jgi:hypothetical protein